MTAVGVRRHSDRHGGHGGGGAAPGRILVVPLDPRGLAIAMPVAVARSASTGGRVTVAAPLRLTGWWAIASAGLCVPAAEPAAATAEQSLREQIAHLAGAAADVRSLLGPPEWWLGALLDEGGFECVLVAGRRLAARRARRLAAVCAGRAELFVLAGRPSSW